MNSSPALEISDLHVHFATSLGSVEVVNGVSLSIERGQVHGLVGESGSGKSVTARSVLGILPRNNLLRRDGSIKFNGEEIIHLGEDALREQVRGRRIAMVFQDPMTALNPVMRIGRQLTIQIRRHFPAMSKKAALARSEDLLDQVGLPDAKDRLRSYPHELSGGQRQRVMIAIALSCNPDVLIADEPTTALDVTVQAQILDLFDKIREERNLSMLIVSHDLSLIAERCDEVSVMYAGRVVETGPAKSIFESPEHPYTRLLEEARPSMDNDPHTLLHTIPGRPPQLANLPPGCSFADRCPAVQADCLDTPPPLEPTHAHGRLAACFHPNSERDGMAIPIRTGVSQ